MKGTKYILSIGFADYRYSIGGTAKVITEHSKLFSDNNIGYLFIFPLNLSHSHPLKNNPFWGIVEDREFKGVFHINGILNYLEGLNNNGKTLQCVHIHHLLKINYHDLKYLLSFIRGNVILYLHDYYSVCVSTNLLRSDTKELCHGKLDAKNCSGCRYYMDSLKMKEVVKDILDSISADYWFVCPSKEAEDHFRIGYPEYAKKTKVIYHQKLVHSYNENRNVQIPLRVAYLGSPLINKGWNQFEKIVNVFSDSNEYQFFYFGINSIENMNVFHIKVEFKDNLNAMVDALRKYKIDCAILWSTCPETYSYTYYEALASNCYVISNKNSGNIQFQIKNRKNGLILDSDDDLFHLFSNSKFLIETVKTYKKNSTNIPLRLEHNDEILQFSMDKAAELSSINPKIQERFVCECSDRLMDALYRWRFNKWVKS